MFGRNFIAIVCGSIALLTLAACGASQTRTVRTQYPSRAMGVPMSYATYLPPGFDKNEKLPLIVFLHGGGDAPDVFDRHGLSPMLDRAVADGTVPRAVIVLPQGDNGMWANWYDGTRRYEDWVVRELIPEAQRRFNTQACPDGCHLMGVSMGGSGTTRFALHNPGLFGSIAMISAPMFNTAQMIEFSNDALFRIAIPFHRIFGPSTPVSHVQQDDPYLHWRSQADLHGSRLFVAWGTNDRAFLSPLNDKFRAHLIKYDIAHGHEVYEGNHSWVSWNPVILRVIKAQLHRR